MKEHGWRVVLSSNLSSRNSHVLAKGWSSSGKENPKTPCSEDESLVSASAVFCCSSHCCKMEKGAYKQQTKIQYLRASPINMTAVGFVHGNPERTKAEGSSSLTKHITNTSDIWSQCLLQPVPLFPTVCASLPSHMTEVTGRNPQVSRLYHFCFGRVCWWAPEIRLWKSCGDTIQPWVVLLSQCVWLRLWRCWGDAEEIMSSHQCLV